MADDGVTGNRTDAKIDKILDIKNRNLCYNPIRTVGNSGGML